METGHDKPKSFAELLRNSEGTILILGMALFVGYVAVLTAGWLFFPHYYSAFAGIMVSNAVFGRLVGLGVGFAADMGFFTNVFINVYVESTLVLLFYPLFILSWNRLLNFETLRRWSERLHGNAERYRGKINRYGVIGLFLFVLFPFWMTGPIVGAIIGYLMGLRHRVTLSIVITGTFFATIVWAWMLKHVQDWAETIDERAPWLIVFAIVLLVLFGLIIRRFRSKQM
jgi:uncharacterized membrane protein